MLALEMLKCRGPGPDLARMRGILDRLRLKPGLLGRFTLLSLLAVIVMGLVLAETLKQQIRERALANAAQSADLIARFGIQPQLAGTDLSQPLAPEAIDSLDRLLHAGYSSEPVLSITVFNRRGRVVYSSEHALIGRRFPATYEMRNAMGGRRAARVNDNPGHADRGSGTLIDATVPLQFSADEPASGMLEVHMTWAPVAATIRRDTTRLYLFLTIGLVALWAVMYRIAAGASRELRTQSAHNAYQARHDALTGLPNRAAFYEAVEVAVASATTGGPQAAAMIIDLDRFKEVNDTLGHHSGDELLRQAAARLRVAVRDSDLLARLGGDEFAVLLPTIASVDQAVAAAERIRTALEQPFSLREIVVHVGASVGIAVAPEHGTTAEDLLQRSDVAMYLAKESSSHHAIYEQSADPYSARRLAMVSELRRAMNERELEVHYQPKATIASGAVAGVEALVRWNHPERGMIQPDDFIPIAEQTGLINRLTVYVLDAALRQCAAWRADGIDLAVAVNLSVRNIADADLPETVAGLLSDHRVLPSRLVLELTESTLMADPARAKDVLVRLNRMGVGISIDDFGTGYSSLTYLSELPVTELKIDRSFVKNMATSDGDAFIVRAAIDLGRNLGLRVVAEGVEDESVWRALAELGCDVAQGYYLSRPVPAAELVNWLQATDPVPIRRLIGASSTPSDGKGSA
jgi:diguanylate cyclase (GGDEF)-like protein